MYLVILKISTFSHYDQEGKKMSLTLLHSVSHNNETIGQMISKLKLRQFFLEFNL